MPSDDFWADLPEKRSALKNMPPLPPEEDALPSDVNHHVPLPRTWLGPLGWLATRLVLLFIGIGFGLGIWGWQTLHQPFDPTATTPTIVDIAAGTGSRAVAEQLADDRLLLSPWPFLAYLKLSGEQIRAGVYTVRPNQTGREILKVLAGGDVTEHQVTIPEGWRSEQIAELLERNGIVGRDELLAASRYDPVRYTLPPGITLAPGDSLEGFLFPDTYLFRYGATAKEIVATLLDTFTKKTAELRPTLAQVNLAAIVEREAKFDGDRAAIAGVYQNRLKTNLRLEADPTVQYAKANMLYGCSETAPGCATPKPAEAGEGWWQPITASDYQGVKSPYNTYLVASLPPGPIANPGLASLAAAVHPAEHAYYFFFNLPDGSTIFSGNQEEHERQKQAQLH